MKQPTSRTSVAFALALVVLVANRLRGDIPGYRDLHIWLLTEVHVLAAQAVGPLILVVASLLLARFAAGAGNATRALGLRAPVGKGLLLGFVIGLPMLLQAPFSSNGFAFTVEQLHAIVTAPFNEEVFFRGMLVLVPVYVGGRRFWPFAIGAGLLFGSVHVPWDDRIGMQYFATFAATAAGGIWYAWLLRCFDRNLWLTISLHATMNAAWALFDVSDDAAGGLWPNVGRGLTIALGTVLALRRSRN
ncbi:MAG: type II CAAX prenyl endopeptidase Rce1 family protein [Planctomycetota bacterium]